MGAVESSFLNPDDPFLSNANQKVIIPKTPINTSPQTESQIKRREIGRVDEIILRGSILGSPGTGKTALFQRLRGEDPFKQIIKKENLDSLERKPKTNGIIAWNGEDGISNAKVLLTDGASMHPLDFAIIMIDPLREETLSDAKQIAIGLLNGKIEGITKDDNETNDKNRSNISICFMLNFKDISVCVPEQCLSFQNVKSQVSPLQHLKRNQKINASTSKNEKKYIYCLESSMKNCYGLLPLHNFIQIPYYCRKEFLLQLQLQQISTNQVKASTNLRNKLQNQDYSKFLTVLGSNHRPGLLTTDKSIPNKPSMSDPDNAAKSFHVDSKLRPPTPSKKSIKSKNKIPNKGKTPQQSNPNDSATSPPMPVHSHENTSKKSIEEINHTQNSNSHRRIEVKKSRVNTSTRKPKFTNTRMPIYDPNQTLDDFFADDDDHDGGYGGNDVDNDRKEFKEAKGIVVNSKDSNNEDEEDDFYFDLSGQKILTNGSKASNSNTNRGVAKIKSVIDSCTRNPPEESKEMMLKSTPLNSSKSDPHTTISKNKDKGDEKMIETNGAEAERDNESNLIETNRLKKKISYIAAEAKDTNTVATPHTSSNTEDSACIPPNTSATKTGVPLDNRNKLDKSKDRSGNPINSESISNKEMINEDDRRIREYQITSEGWGDDDDELSFFLEEEENVSHPIKSNKMKNDLSPIAVEAKDTSSIANPRSLGNTEESAFISSNTNATKSGVFLYDNNKLEESKDRTSSGSNGESISNKDRIYEDEKRFQKSQIRSEGWGDDDDELSFFLDEENENGEEGDEGNDMSHEKGNGGIESNHDNTSEYNSKNPGGGNTTLKNTRTNAADEGWSDDDMNFIVDDSSTDDVPGPLEIDDYKSKIDSTIHCGNGQNRENAPKQIDDISSDDDVGFIIEDDDSSYVNNTGRNENESIHSTTNQTPVTINKNKPESSKMSEAALAAIASAKEELLATLSKDNLQVERHHIASLETKSKHKKKSKSEEKTKKKKKKSKKKDRNKNDDAVHPDRADIVTKPKKKKPD